MNSDGEQGARDRIGIGGLPDPPTFGTTFDMPTIESIKTAALVTSLSRFCRVLLVHIKHAKYLIVLSIIWLLFERFLACCHTIQRFPSSSQTSELPSKMTREAGSFSHSVVARIMVMMYPSSGVHLLSRPRRSAPRLVLHLHFLVFG
jgi:hypothetical protein